MKKNVVVFVLFILMLSIAAWAQTTEDYQSWQLKIQSILDKDMLSDTDNAFLENELKKSETRFGGNHKQTVKSKNREIRKKIEEVKRYSDPGLDKKIEVLVQKIDAISKKVQQYQQTIDSLERDNTRSKRKISELDNLIDKYEHSRKSIDSLLEQFIAIMPKADEEALSSGSSGFIDTQAKIFSNLCKYLQLLSENIGLSLKVLRSDNESLAGYRETYQRNRHYPDFLEKYIKQRDKLKADNNLLTKAPCIHKHLPLIESRIDSMKQFIEGDSDPTAPGLWRIFSAYLKGAFKVSGMPLLIVIVTLGALAIVLLSARIFMKPELIISYQLYEMNPKSFVAGIDQFRKTKFMIPDDPEKGQFFRVNYPVFKNTLNRLRKKQRLYELVPNAAVELENGNMDYHLKRIELPFQDEEYYVEFRSVRDDKNYRLTIKIEEFNLNFNDVEAEG